MAGVWATSITSTKSTPSFEDRFLNLGLKFLIAGCMIFYVPGQMFYIPQENYFCYAAMGMTALCFWIPKKRETSNLFFGLVLGYGILNTVIFRFIPQTRMILNNVFIGMVLIKMLSERIDFNFKVIGNLMAILCTSNVLWIILQILKMDPVFSSSMPQNMPQVDLVGFMALKSNLGVLAALSLPFIMAANPFNAIICIPLLWFGQASTCIASCALTLLFMLWFKNKKAFWWVVAFVVAGAAWYVFKVDMPTGQFGKRLDVWLAGISFLASKNPWFGNGLGSWITYRFTTLQENGMPQTWVWAHNEFLQFIFELGFFGAIVLYAYFKDLFLKVDLKNKNHQTAITILIPIISVSIFHFPFHLGRFAGMLCFMIACIEGLLSKPFEDFHAKA